MRIIANGKQLQIGQPITEPITALEITTTPFNPVLNQQQVAMIKSWLNHLVDHLSPDIDIYLYNSIICNISDIRKF